MSWFVWPGWKEYFRAFGVQILVGVFVVALAIAAVVGWLVRR